MLPLYPTALTVEDLQRNLRAVRERIAGACARVGRDPAEVRVLAVSKTVPERRVRLAYAAGCRDFGENKVQEASLKARPNRPGERPNPDQNPTAWRGLDGRRPLVCAWAQHESRLAAKETSK